MIGLISAAHAAGREDRRRGRRPATAWDRIESKDVHTFYLMGFHEYAGPVEYEQLPLELSETASQDAPGSRLDMPRDS